MDVLRVHIITEEDPFYVPCFFREFFHRLPKDRFVVTGLDITPPLGQRSRVALVGKLHRFYGTRDFARLLYRYAVERMKDRLLPSSAWDGTVARLAKRHGVPSEIVSAVNDPAYVERVRRRQPDLLVSVAASQIFRKELLAVPRLDAVNIHTGTLPRYRGMLPVFWQLRDGQREIGLTIHTMTEAIDLGEILLHRAVPVDRAWTLDGAFREMKRHGARALLDVFEQYRTGHVTRMPMDRSQSGYRSFPVSSDAQAFRAMGFDLL